MRAWLESLTDPELELVVGQRPDVLRGAPPRDLDDLAARLAHPAGVSEAIGRVVRPDLQLLEAAVLTGAGATIERLCEVLAENGEPADAHRDSVEGAVARLCDLALAWPDGSLVRTNPGLARLVEAPHGLARPAATVLAGIPAAGLSRVVRRWGLDAPTRKGELVELVGRLLAEPAHVRRVVADAPPVVRDRLLGIADEATARARTVASGGSVDDRQYRAAEGAGAVDYAQILATSRWAIEAGLGYDTGWGRAEYPAEVLLALAVDATLPFDPHPPFLAYGPLDAARVEASAAAAAGAALRDTVALCEDLARTPASTLRSGYGVGVREVGRIAKSLAVGPARVRLLLTIAAGLGLVEAGPSGLGVSERFDAWRALAPADRASDVLHAWWHLPAAPTRDRDEEGKAVPALAAFVGTADGALRLLLLDTAVAGPQPVTGQAQALASPSDLADLAAWMSPLDGADPLDVVATWAEATALGVVAHDAASSFGRALREGEVARLRDELAMALPGVTTRARFGSDLTAVVLGAAAPELVDLLDAACVRESRGEASTWRFTPASVRSALDTGIGADELLDRLRAVADGELPQPVVYLVRDVARRHGHVAVRPAGAVLVSDDEPLLAELVAARPLRGLALRAVAPTVLVADRPAAEVVAALRGAGYFPRELDAAGEAVLTVGRAPRSAPRATPAPPRVHGAQVQAAPVRAPLDPADVVRGLRSGGFADPPVEELVLDVRRHARRLTDDEVRQLAHAVHHHAPVHIVYRSASGGTSSRLVSELQIVDRYLYGWCHLRSDFRSFRLDELHAVSAA